MQANDTSSSAREQQAARLQVMSPAEKSACVDALNRDVQLMAEAGIRRRHPTASDREVFLRLAALRIGRDLSIAAYGWDPDIEGW